MFELTARATTSNTSAQPTYFNPDHVVWIRKDGGGTEVRTVRDTYRAKETLDKALKRFKDAR